jgi:hypothetical protein
VKPADNRTARDQIVFPLQAGFVSYRYLKFGSQDQILGTLEKFFAKSRFLLCPGSV